MSPDFGKSNGLVPAIVQDAISNKVLMLGYMNQEAFDLTRSTGNVTFFSRSKDRIWVKGETSGNFLKTKSVLLDCDNDAILVKADPVGPACHTGADTCFKEDNIVGGEFLNYLAEVIKDRRVNPDDNSYTASLFAKGINKMAQKVGEEAVELVIEAKDDNDDLFKNEAADLLFHFLVLLEAKQISLEDIVEVLKSRHKSSK